MNALPQPLQVLLVDDHPMVRIGIRAALRLHFPAVHVVEAGCADEALERCAQFQPDLILLDVNLPGTSGLDLAARLRTHNRRARLLMVAAEADPWTVQEALEAGALGFLAKTSSGELLPEAVHTVLGGEVFLCPSARAALGRADAAGSATAKAPGPAVLSRREREILRHIAQGENTKTIAAQLEVSPKTVETHRQHIMRKLGLQSVAALTRYAIRHGMTPT